MFQDEMEMIKVTSQITFVANKDLNNEAIECVARNEIMDDELVTEAILDIHCKFKLRS